MQAVVKPASTAPWVARKPAPPAPTTTTSNVWSMKLYARVELMLFLDGLRLDADRSKRRRRRRLPRLQKRNCSKPTTPFGSLVVNVVFEDDMRSDSHMPCSGKDEQQHRTSIDREVRRKRSRPQSCFE